MYLINKYDIHNGSILEGTICKQPIFELVTILSTLCCLDAVHECLNARKLETAYRLNYSEIYCILPRIMFPIHSNRVLSSII